MSEQREERRGREQRRGGKEEGDQDNGGEELQRQLYEIFSLPPDARQVPAFTKLLGVQQVCLGREERSRMRREEERRDGLRRRDEGGKTKGGVEGARGTGEQEGEGRKEIRRVQEWSKREGAEGGTNNQLTSTPSILSDADLWIWHTWQDSQKKISRCYT
jgi:hypothetical protein